jgi:hypothetical protein
MVAAGALVGAIGLAAFVVWVFSRISKARERELRDVAAREGWTLPEAFDLVSTPSERPEFVIEAQRGDVAIAVRVMGYGAVARAVGRGGGHPYRPGATVEEGRIVSRPRGETDASSWTSAGGTEEGRRRGLAAASSGVEDFDAEFQLFTASGSAPSWLTEAVRTGLLTLREPVTVVVDATAVSVRIEGKEVIDVRVLKRMIDLCIAIANPQVAATLVGDMRRAARDLKPLSEYYFRTSLWVLPLTCLITWPISCLPAVEEVQSRIVCGPDSELDWEQDWGGRVRVVRSRTDRGSIYRGCDGAGDGTANDAATLLLFVVLAAGGLMIALAVAVVRRSVARGRLSTP